MNHPPVVLSIAGSDSGGGAGIQADIKAITCTGGFATTAITAITAQNTQGVQGVYPLTDQQVAQQLRSVADDFQLAAIKIGMLHSASLCQLVQGFVTQHPSVPLVLDPVLVATQGQSLAQHDLIRALRELMAYASVVTPNLSEAASLLNCAPARTDDEWQAQGQQLLQMGARAVLLKGGHLPGANAVDWLMVPGQPTLKLSKPWVATQNNHGTGCTLASALASFMAQGLSLPESAERAKAYLHQALSHASQWSLGQGPGPVDHAFCLR